MNIDKKPYTGGMDMDSDPHIIKAGDYRYALNCIVGNDETGNLGSVSNTKGTTKIEFPLPLGVPRCIGSHYDSKTSRIFFFMYNNAGNHGIYQYNLKSNTVDSLIESEVLNFDWAQLINDVDLVDDNLLYFTDGWNPPRKINIKKCLRKNTPEGYSSRIQDGSAVSDVTELQDTLLDNRVMIVEEYFDAIKYGPYKEPLISYFNDLSDTTTTRVDRGSFQFKYKWIYDDGESSVYSPISKVKLQNDKAQFFGGIQSFFSLNNSFDSELGGAASSDEIPSSYNKWIPEGTYWNEIASNAIKAQYTHGFDNEVFNLETGEEIFQAGNPFGHVGAVSTSDLTETIVPSGGGQIDGIGNYNANTGEYTAPLDGNYNINISMNAAPKPVVDENGVDIKNKPLLRRFKKPNKASKRYYTTTEANRILYIQSQLTSDELDVVTNFSDWQVENLNNDISYSYAEDETFVLNNDFPFMSFNQDATSASNSVLFWQYPTNEIAKKTSVIGYWGDSLADGSNNKARWNKQYIGFLTDNDAGDDSFSYNSLLDTHRRGQNGQYVDFMKYSTSIFPHMAKGYDQAFYSSNTYPPFILQRVAHYSDYEDLVDGNNDIESTHSNQEDGTLFNFNNSLPGKVQKISYLQYEGEKEFLEDQKPRVQLFLLKTDSQTGVITEYPITNTSGSDLITGETPSDGETYSFSDDEFYMNAGDKLRMKARRFSHVYNCFIDIESGVVYKESVAMGALLNFISMDATYDQTSSDSYTPNSASNNNIKKNALNVIVQTGSELVKKIQVAVRDMEVGSGPEFYKLVEIDKEELGLEDFHNYSIVFKNDKTIKEIIDIAESNRMYDFVPRIARSQEYLNNNRLAYANILEGYNPMPKSGISEEKLNVKLLKDFRYQIDHLNTYSAYPSLIINRTGMETPGGTGAWSNYGASKGDTLTPNYFHSGTGASQYDYGVQIQQDGTQDIIATQGANTATNGNGLTNRYWGSGTNMADGWVMDRNGILSPDSPTLKRGGRYTYGLVYYDRAGRSSMVNSYTNPESPDSMVIDIPWYHELLPLVQKANSNGEANGILDDVDAALVSSIPSAYKQDTSDRYLNGRTVSPPNIFWEIHHKPPKWATHYQWVMTKNENTDYFVHGITGGPTDDNGSEREHFLFYKNSGDLESNDGVAFGDVTEQPYASIDSIRYMDINVEFFYNYEKYYSNGKDEPVMQYSFNKGDKIRFIGYRQGTGNYGGSSYFRLGGQSNSPNNGVENESAAHPDYFTCYWGHGLYRKYIEFEIVDLVDVNGSTHLRVTGDFSIFKEDLFYCGTAEDDFNLHPNPDVNNSNSQWNDDVETQTNYVRSALLKNSMFEIYRTKDEVAQTDKIFYEFGQTFRIGNPHTEDRYHIGELNDQDFDTIMNTGIPKPARGTFGARYQIAEHPIPITNSEGDNKRTIGVAVKSYGDVYTRNRVHAVGDGNNTRIPTLNGTDIISINYNESDDANVQSDILIDEYYVQDQHINDNVSKFEITTGLGRPHIQNDEIGEEWRYSTVRFSDPMIEDTNKNQLNVFYESQNPSLGITSGFVDYEKDYGSIQKIISRDTDLIILHENKTTRALVSKDISTKADGSGDIVISATPLSAAVPYVGDFGVGLNPESVSKFNNVIYFADLRNGAILRLSRDGITRISESGMHKYFKDIARDLLSLDNAIVNVYGQYNSDYNEYIVTFDNPIIVGGTGPTPNVFLDTSTEKVRSIIDKSFKS